MEKDERHYKDNTLCKSFFPASKEVFSLISSFSPKISRRLFLRTATKILLSLGLLPHLPGWLRRAEASDLQFLRQLIAQDNEHTRTIGWQSLEPMKNAVIECRSADMVSWVHAFPANSLPFSDGGASCYLHFTRISGLAPGSDYLYRIVDEAGSFTSDWQPLRTDDGGAFQAIIFPDSQCAGDYTAWRSIAQGAATRHPGAKFFINMGDLVDNGEAAWQWQQWFDALTGIQERLPLAPVMGNHGTYDLNWKCRIPAAWLSYFPVPENHVAHWSRYWYSFDFGPCHFLVLNNLMGELDPVKPGMLDAELPWLRHDAALTSKPWKIVLMHKDIINYEWPDASDPITGDIDPVGRIFMPVFDELGIDAVLTAHQHTYRRLGHIFRFRPADHGPFYIDTGNAGNCYYDVPKNERFDQFLLPQPERGNYMTLDADASKLVFRCYLPDGTWMDTAELTKK